MTSVSAASAQTAGTGDDILIPGIAADGTLFPLEKMDAHRTGQLHAAVSIFVFSQDRLLIQKRAAAKYHSGLKWANTCCTHPQWGEDVAAAAHRRLYEELGFSTELSATETFEYKAEVSDGLIEHERVQVFRGEIDAAMSLVYPNPDEVAEARWVTLRALHEEMTQAPENFAPWFGLYIANWDRLGL